MCAEESYKERIRITVEVYSEGVRSGRSVAEVMRMPWYMRISIVLGHHFDTERIALWLRVIFLFTSLKTAAIIASEIPDIDNGIIGEPDVKCSSDHVELNFRTRNEFRGKVFVKGHYSDPECRIDHSLLDRTGKNLSMIYMTIPHGNCDMTRQRMISPQHGMQMATVIVVSFHPVFITAIDRAYNVRCNYREAETTVTAGMEVSALTTAFVTNAFPMPQCSYSIRKDVIDGEILKYARVGEQVVHRWECDTDVFGILVHSCYVEDGQGERVFVVDENGCHRDRYILGDPTYVEKLNMAYRESHVFKFADRLTVRFKCQIRLCMKMDDGCRGITPPICASPPESSQALLLGNTTVPTVTDGPGPAVAGARTTPNFARLLYHLNESFEAGLERQKREIRRADQMEMINGDFVSQDVYVLESIETPDNRPFNGTEPLVDAFQEVPNPPGGVCLSLAAFSSMIALILIVVTTATLAAFYLIFIQACRKPVILNARRP